MSREACRECPSKARWSEFATSRDGSDPEAAEDARFDALLEHAQTCRRCRTAALTVDPTLLFQGLPAIELAAEEVSELQQRVAGVRRSRRVAGGLGGALSPLHRWSVAAGLCAALVLGVGATVFSIGDAESVSGDQEATASRLSPEDVAAIEESLAARPMVEGPVNVMLHVASANAVHAWVVDEGFDL